MNLRKGAAMRNILAITINNYSYQINLNSEESRNSCVQQVNKSTSKHFKWFKETTGNKNYVLYDSDMFEIGTDDTYDYLHYKGSCSKPPVMPFNASSCYMMFSELNGKKELDFSHFDTSKIITMNSMFTMSKFKSLDLSPFNTENVEDTSFMFYQCRYLEQTDLNSFINCKVTDTSFMFLGCNSLIKIDLSKFNLQNAIKMCDMFGYCTALKEVKLSKAAPEYIEHLFHNCSNLIIADLSDVDFTKLKASFCAFYNCKKLKTIYSDDWALLKRLGIKVFYGCESLPNFNPERVNSDMAKSIEDGGYFTTTK